MFNPHGLTNEDDLALNSKLYQTRCAVIVQAEFKLVGVERLLVAAADLLQ